MPNTRREVEHRASVFHQRVGGPPLLRPLRPGRGRRAWNDLSRDIHAWRLELGEQYGIPLDRELHACDLLAGRGLLAGSGSERLTPRQGAEVFLGGLRRIEDAAKASAA